MATSNNNSLSFKFPLTTCGEPNPGGTNQWYPVYVNDSDANLAFIKNNYCQDAFRHYRKKENIYSIQVASFVNYWKADELAKFLKQTVGSGEVGEPSYYNFEKILEQKNINHSFPLDTCGEPDPIGINTWYPVYVVYTEEQLRLIKREYCRDAIQKYREEQGIESIQVASFLTYSKAQEFAEVLRKQVGSGEVGKPNIH